MLATTRMPELVTFLAGILLYGGLLWSIRRRFLQKLDLVFSQSGDEAPDSAEINKRLDSLNLDSAHFVFTMDRHANLRFRQKRITLVYGHIGTRSPGGIRGPAWTLKKRVYALADQRQAEWMNRHPDVFERATTGYNDSVFWVNLDGMLPA